MNEHDDGWSPAERRSLSELPRELAPPPEIERRILSALRDRGLIRTARPRARAWLPLGAAAAGLLLLAAGFTLGRSSAAGRSAVPSPRFALLLLRGEERLPEPAEQAAARVEEYRTWARGLAASGRFVTGEKLEDRAERVGPASPSDGAPPGEEIRGFFVISAADFEEALVVARGCPHLRHGGWILVRPIAPV